MHFQIASLVALLALVSDTTAAPAPAPEPILPLLAAGGAIAKRVDGLPQRSF